MGNSIAVQVERTAGGWVCEVDVNHAGQESRHTVKVSPADVARWGRGERDEDVEDLVRRSFDFLLDREPPGSILLSFDLSVIQRYFPEYDRRFKR